MISTQLKTETTPEKDKKNKGSVFWRKKLNTRRYVHEFNPTKNKSEIGLRRKTKEKREIKVDEEGRGKRAFGYSHLLNIYK